MQLGVVHPAQLSLDLGQCVNFSDPGRRDVMPHVQLTVPYYATGITLSEC